MTDLERLQARLAEAERRLKDLEFQQRTFDVHLRAIEESILFRLLRRFGRPLLDAKTRIARMIGRNASLDPGVRAWAAEEGVEPLPHSAPTITLLLRIVTANAKWLEGTVASVLAQTYSNWRLCVSPVTSSDPAIIDVLSRAQNDARVQMLSWDADANLPEGDYIILLDEGATLSRTALASVAAAHPADIIYTDEDRVDGDGRSCQPVFKPGWSPDLLLACMYLGGLVAFSRTAVERAGDLRPDRHPFTAYDLALRIADGPCSVRRVPRVLYHLRRDAATPSRLRVALLREVVEDAVRRRGLGARVEEGPSMDSVQLRWIPAEDTLVSVIVCSRSPRLLDRCLDSLSRRTAYGRREVIVVQHLGAEDAALEAAIGRHRARRVPYSGRFHFSRMNNLGAQAAAGDVLVFLNDDVEPLESSWLGRLVAQVQRPDVAIAGAQLLYPTGTLQHAGVTVGIGDGCAHVGRGGVDRDWWPWLQLSRDVSAVTGACLAIRASVFNELGGFADEFPVNYNDVDLCLRARSAGHRVIYEAGARLRHDECQTRSGTVTLCERQQWYRKWSDLIDSGDPFYTPHLTRDREDLSLRELP